MLIKHPTTEKGCRALLIKFQPTNRTSNYRIQANYLIFFISHSYVPMAFALMPHTERVNGTYLEHAYSARNTYAHTKSLKGHDFFSAISLCIVFCYSYNKSVLLLLFIWMVFFFWLTPLTQSSPLLYLLQCLCTYECSVIPQLSLSVRQISYCNFITFSCLFYGKSCL